MGGMETSSSPPFPTSLALSAPRDPQETREAPARRDPAAQRAQPERTARTETRETPVCKAPLGSKAPSARPAPQDPREPQDESTKSTAQSDPRDPPAHPDIQERRAPAGWMGRTRAAGKDPQETTGPPDRKELQGPRDPQDLRDPMESREAASTAHLHALHQAIKHNGIWSRSIGLLALCFLHYLHNHHKINSTTT